MAETHLQLLIGTVTLIALWPGISPMIRLVWGDGTARTAKASFDAALADANLHQYNLRKLSSVIPADATVDVVGEAPDIGPTGHAVDVVFARQTSPPGTRAAAGLAWTRAADGTGIFYEAGNHDPETVRERLDSGIEHGCALRDISDPTVERQVVTAGPSPDEYTTVVVLAVYGESESLL
jgi:arginine decarboxylase